MINSTELPARTTAIWAAVLLTIAASLLIAWLQSPETAQAQDTNVCHADDMKAKVYIEGPDSNAQQYDTTDDPANVSANALALKRGPEGISINYTLVFSGEYITPTEDGNPCKDRAAPTDREGFAHAMPYVVEAVGKGNPIPEAWVELIFNDGADTTPMLPAAIGDEEIAEKGQEADWGGRDFREQPYNIGGTQDAKANDGGIPLRQPVGINVRPGNNDTKYLVANLVTYTTASYNTGNKIKKVLATTYIELEAFPEPAFTYTPVPGTGDETPLTLTEGGGITNDQGDSIGGLTIDLHTPANPTIGDPGAPGKDTTLSHTFWLESSCAGPSEIGRVELPTQGDVTWKLEQAADDNSFRGTLSRLIAFDDSLWERTEELCLHGGIKAEKVEDPEIQYSTMTTNPLTLEDNEPDPSLTLELGPELDNLAEGKYTVEAKSQTDTSHKIRYRAALSWDPPGVVPEYPVIFTMSVLDGTAVLGTHYDGEHEAGTAKIPWTTLSDVSWNGQVDVGLSFSGEFDLTALGTAGKGPSHELEVQAAITGSGVEPAGQTIAMVNPAPAFPTLENGMRAIREIPGAGTVETTARKVGIPVRADDNDDLTYTLGGDDAGSFDIDGNGQLTTKIGTSYDYEAQASYELVVTADDGTSTAEQTVTVNLADLNDAPVFSDGDTATRSLAENSGANVNVGAAVSAMDQDGDTLTYTLSGTDAGSFEIDGSTGQLRTKEGVTYDYESPKNTYSVTVGVSDGNGDSDSITVTVNLTDVNDAPVFTEVESATRSLAENTAAGENVGDPLTAADQDRPEDTLVYSISAAETAGNADRNSFEIDGPTGQLKTKSGVSYDLETKASYSVTVEVSDGNGGSDSIAVTVNLTDVNDAPVFTEGDSATRSLAENSGANVNVGAAVSATDQDRPEDTLVYSISAAETAANTDRDSFEIEPNTGQLKTKSGVSYDLETKPSYSITVEVSDGNGGSDSITVTVNLTDVNDVPVFSDGDSTTRAFAENTAAGENVGAALTATDQDGDTLTYTLGGTDAASFEIDDATGQLTTKQSTPYDYETKSSYTVTVTATDPEGAADSIAVTVNLTDANDAPTFDEGASATRSLAENSGANVNVGLPLTATDQDGDTLTYTLGGTDAGSFEIDGSSGQLQTKEGVSYDLETKASYSVTVTATDADRASDTIAVTINLTDVNDAPVFTEGDSTTRNVPENSGANVDVGLPISATDQDGDTLAYSLSGDDAGSFEIVETTGQLQTKEGVSYDLEAKASYSVTVGVSDGTASDSITVTISLTDVNDAPVFTEGESATRSLAENTAAGENVGNPVAATDQDGDTLTYTLSGADAMSFEIDGETGQLTTKSGVSYDYEKKTSYAVTVTATDPDNAADTIAVTINLTDDLTDTPIISIETVDNAVTEGQPAQFRVMANPAPTVNIEVELTIASSGGYVADGEQGTKTVRIAANTDSADYDVTTIADNVDEANGTVTATVTTGTGYNVTPTANDATATVAVNDDDTRAATVDPTAVTVAEKAGTQTYSVVLKSEPTADVTVTPSSSDGSIATVSGALTFTPLDWNTEQDVTVTGVNDDIDNADDNRTATITHTVAGGDYGSVTAQNVTVTVTDDDTKGITTNPTEVTVAEDARTTSYTVVLDSQPTADVTVTLAIAEVEGADAITLATTGNLTFTNANWNTPQTVELTVTDDDFDNTPNDRRTVTITHTAGGGDYGSVSETLTVIVTDDDGPNAAPSFDGTATTRDLLESIGAATNTGGTPVGDPVAATDADDATLTYSLSGTDASSFGIDTATGQIKTKTGDNYDHEDKPTYTVIVSVHDGKAADGRPDESIDDDITVTINITDEVEEPQRPPAPTIETTGNRDSLRVIPNAPDNAGRPPITGYDLQYRPKDTDEAFTLESGIGAQGHIISPLLLNTEYEVQVRARNDEGTGDWSPSATRRTGTATVTIVATPDSINESGTTNLSAITARLDGHLTQDLTLTVSATPEPPAEASDFTLSQDATLTIAAGQTDSSGTVTVTSEDNKAENADRTVNVGATSATANLTIEGTTITIEDDDTAAGTVTLALTPETIDESGTGNVSTVTATLAAASTEETVITVSVSEDAPVALSENTVLTVTAGETETIGTVTITAADDSVYTGDRYATVSGAARNAVGVSDPADVTLTVAEDETESTTVTLRASPSELTEAGGEQAVTVTATLNHAAFPHDLTVNLTVSDGTASADDYTAVSPVTLNVAGGQTSGTAVVNITPANDAIDEDNENVSIGGTAEGLNVTATTVTITDDDNAPTGVTLSVSPATINESADATTITVTATLDGATTRNTETVVNINTTGDTATENTDYRVTTALTSITIPAAATSGAGALTITPIDDTVVEGNETITVTGTTDVAGLSVNDAVITLTDGTGPGDGTEPGADERDQAELSISGPTGSVLEGEYAVFTVTLSHQVAAQVQVEWTAPLEGDRAENSDLGSHSGTLTFAANSQTNATREIRIQATDDQLSETDESFTVTLGDITSTLSEQVSLKEGESSTEATIAESDPITVSIAGPATVAEGDATGEYTVSISGGTPTENLTVDYGTNDGTATAGTDYSAQSGNLTFAASETSKNFAVQTTEDDIDEGTGQTFTVTISNPLGGGGPAPTLGTSVVTTTITDDDATPTSIRLSTNTSKISESDAATTITVTATIEGGTTRNTPTTVNINPLTGTATLGTDYTVSTDLNSITIPAGQPSNTSTLGITPTDDDVVEGDETITITGTADGLTVSPATITLTDGSQDGDGTDPGPDQSDNAELSISRPDSPVVEGGNATFTVTLSHEVAADVSVEWSVTPDTAEGADLSITPGTLTFRANSDAGETQNIVIAVTDDELSETAESFTVTLGNITSTLSEQVSLKEGEASTQATIAESDPIEVSIAGPATVAEGDATGEYTVSISGGTPTETLSVNYGTGDGTATAGNDYEPTTGALTFTTMSAGSQTFTVQTTQDVVDEGAGETFTVTIANPSGGGGPDPTLGTASVETTITDDDDRGITATADRNVTTETGETATVSVILNSQPTADVTISAQSSNTDEGTASPAELTFTAGNWSTAQEVTVTGQDDSVDDGDIGYTVTFTAASTDRRYEGQSATVELTNTDDDTRSVDITTTSTTDPPTLRISEIAPGNTASYTVVLTSQPSDGNVTVTPVSSATDNATVSAALIFTPQNWDTAQQVTITAVDDLIDNDADRTATITHEVAGADYGRHNVVAGSIEVTVTDNDEKGVTVSATELTVGETGDGSYTIVLNSQPTGTVTVTPATAGNHPEAIAITPPELTFTPGNWNNPQTVTVTGQRDHVDNEADRTASISHSANGDYTGVTIAGVEVTITDSDQAGVTLGEADASIIEAENTSYTVVLDSRPRTGHVVKINITVTGPADANTSSLTFTRENWDVPQSISVTAHDDGVVSVPQSAVVSHQIADAESSPEYSTVVVDDVSFDIVEDDHAPVFTDGDPTNRSLDENSGPGVNVGAAVEATDGDNDTLTYTLSGTDAGSFAINEETGQITTQETSYDFETKRQYDVTVTASDTHGNTDTIAVTINLTDVNDAPVFSDGASATREVPENSAANVEVGAPLSATDQDRPVNTLVYSLTGADVESFDIDGGTGQLTTKSGVSYDLETKASYSVTVEVSDGHGGSDSIAVTINLTDANDAPVFTEGDSATRSVPENSGAGVNVGLPLTATDQDGGDTLAYTLGGTDADSFGLVETSGQLTTKSGVSYDLEAKASYSVTVTVTDPDNASDTITVTINLTDANDAPVFTEGDATTRSLAENTGAGENVGLPLAATDQDNDTLTYTLSGADAGSFDIDGSTGQLQTKEEVAYDLEGKASYSVTVTVTDPDSAADTITVTINLTDANDAPVFTEGESTTRNLAENTAAGENVGNPVAATDQDGDALTYTLGGTDAGSFDIDGDTGQLTTKQGASYDLETKASFSVTVMATDPDNSSDTITVTINLTDANDAPVFTEGESATRSLAENTAAGQNVGAAVSATDQDNDTLTYTLGGTDAGSFEIDDSSGQLNTKSGVSYDLENKASYSVTVTATDPHSATDTITVTVNLTDANDAPVFTEGESATRSLAENTAAGQNVGAAVSATDQDGDTLAYTLSGDDAESFEIVETTGQLTTKSGVSYDLETKASYSVTVTATDPDSAADSIAVTINLTDANDAPVFTEGESATRSLAENIGAGENVGNPVAATDQDGDTLTYTLGGADAGSFEIDGSSGQLTTKQGSSYDLEAKASYAVTVEVSDGTAADSIAVTINLTDANDAPVFTEGESATRSLAENTAAGRDVDNPVVATDQDGDTLAYTLSGADADSFDIDGSTGQLQTKEGVAYDLETKASYTVTVTATDADSATDSIVVTVNLTDANDAPVFTEGDSAARSVPENSGANVNVGAAVSATDQDGDTLAYTLTGTDAGSFEIDAGTGQLTTKEGVSYDLEGKASYSVTVTVTDPDNAADTIAVTINLTDANDAPVFNEGDSTTRSLAENCGAGVNVGAAVSATDQDGDTLAYTLSGADAGSFDIHGSSGQLQTKEGVDYDLETKAVYSVTVTATDPDSGADSIAVTINLTDANDAPTFDDGNSATRNLAENTAAGQNVGAAVSATDQDAGDTLTYSLSGTDAASFDINGSTGQIQTKSGVTYNYETKAAYSFTVAVSDGAASDSIAVTVNLTDVNDPPAFSEGENTTRSVPENTGADVNVGLPVTATDEDQNPTDALTYTLGGDDSDSFAISASTGQLTTKQGVNYDLETKASYSVTVTATDPDDASDAINVTINLSGANDAPTFTEAPTATRTLAENTATGEDVGLPLTAMDQDGDTLTYTLGGTDAGSFVIDDSSGQLQTKSGVTYDYETKPQHWLTVIATDNGTPPLTGQIDVTVTVTDVAEPPAAPNAPEVRVGTTPDTLVVNWAAPENTGPEITSYNLRYRISGTTDSFEQVNGITEENETIGGLETGTEYAVQVQAINDEGESDWSTSGTGTTGSAPDITLALTPQAVTEGETATVTATMDTPLSQDTTVTVTTEDPGVLLSEDTRLTISAGNMNSTGTVTAKTTDDQVDRPDRQITISGTSTPDATVNSATLTVRDNDNAGITVSSPTLRIAEAGGTDTYTVVLDSQPEATITVGLTVEGASEAVSLSQATVQFTTDNWDATQEITVTGIPDNTDNSASDGSNDHRVATISHTVIQGEYQATDKTVSVTVTDDDQRGISAPTRSVELDESGADASATYSMALETQPTENVTITPRSEDTTIAIVSGALEFTPENWETGQEVTVTAVPDNVDNPSDIRTTTITHTVTGGDYEGAIAGEVSVTVRDDDASGITLTPSSIEMGEGATTEYTVALNSEPTGTVTITMAKTGDAMAVNLSTDSLTLTAADWSSGKTVTVTSVQDMANTIRSLTISHAASGAGYDGQTKDLTITVNDTNLAPSFSAATIEFNIPENSPGDTEVGTLSATDPESGTLTYSLSGTAEFQIDANSGTITTQQGAQFDHETERSREFTGRVQDEHSAQGEITVTVNITNVNEAPAFDGETATRHITENQPAGTAAGDPVAATDEDGDTLSYELSGDDAALFSIDVNGQITNAVELDREGGTTRSVTVTAMDGDGLTDSIDVTIQIDDVDEPPVFEDGEAASRTIAENPQAGVPIGAPVRANDPEGQDVTHTLEGDDAGSFSIDESTGQLRTKAGIPYNYEGRNSYSVTVSASDGTHPATIPVTVTLTDMNDRPTFQAGGGDAITLEMPENPEAGQLIGTITATDEDAGDTITYSLTGTDAGAFSINADNGQLTAKSGIQYDREVKESYQFNAVATDQEGASDTIMVTVTLTDVNDAPVFTEGDRATRSLQENTAAGQNVGTAVTATDQDGDTLTYSLSGTDAASFDIDGSTGQLRTKSGVTYDYEARASYLVTIEVSDSHGGSDSINVTVNLTNVDEVPTFNESDSTTRSLAENTPAGESIGAPVAATDPDGGTLTYALSGTDAGSFDINAATGQLTTKQEVTYDYESSKRSYSVTITATDPQGNADSIAVTINLTEANDPPVFSGGDSEGDNATRTLAENSGAGVNVGAAVSATDQDNDTLTYSLGGTDAGSFDINAATGQLTTKQGVAYDYEAKRSYSVTVTATDLDSAADSIAVTVNLNDVNEAPVFAEGGSATRRMSENIPPGSDVGTPVRAVDPEGDTVTYTITEGTQYPFAIDRNGQLKTQAGVNYDWTQRRQYPITVKASDPAGLSNTISVTIQTRNPGECRPANNPQGPEASGHNPFANTAPELQHFPALRVRQNISFRIPFPRGEGENLRYDMERTDTGAGLDSRTSLPGVSFDPNTRVLSGMLKSCDGQSPGIYPLRYTIIQEDDTQESYEFTLATSEQWSKIFIDPEYPRVGTGEYATFILRGSYAYNAPEVYLEITTTTAEGTTVSRPDPIPVPVTITGGASQEYAVPTTAPGTITVRLLLRKPDTNRSVYEALPGYLISTSLAQYHTATVQVIDGWENFHNVEPTITVAGKSAPATAHPEETITLSGWHNINPPYPAGTNELTYYEWSLCGEPTDCQTLGTGRTQSVTIPADATGDTKLNFRLQVSVRPAGAQSADIGMATIEVKVVPVSEASPSGTTRPQPTIQPTACAGPDLTGASGTEITLEGRCSTNPYGPWYQMEHGWTQLSGPPVTLSDASVGNPSFTLPSDAVDGTTLVFELTVTDREGESDTDTMTVTVGQPEPVQPTANAGPDLTGTPGESITLQGTGSANPYGEWWRMAHQWTQLSGPSVTLDEPTHGDPTFTIPDDAAGGTTLEFQLTVTDKEGQSDSDTMIVTVTGAEPENTPPTASIDQAQVTMATAGETVALQGVGGDAETAAESLTFAWSQAAGTPSVSIANAGAAAASFTAPDVTEQTQLTFRLTVTDEEGLSTTVETTVTINPPEPASNRAPAFEANIDTALAVAENSPAGTNVGGPIAATDPDGDTLTYTLSGADAGSFSIAAGTGQVTTKEGVTYNYEAKSAYVVMVNAADGKGLSASIPVMVNLTNVNESPTFDEEAPVTRQVAENSNAGINVGLPIIAADPDGDTLTYALSGPDAGSFDLDTSTGQLTTKEGATYDYDSQAIYALTVTAEDPEGTSASTSVTIHITDINEAPAFTEGEATTRSVAENSGPNVNVGEPITATDADGDTLTYSLSGDDAGSFDLNPATGQLTTVAGVTYDHETQAAYSLVVTVADGNGGTASIPVTVNLTDVNEAPAFGEGSSTTRQVAENSAAGVNVGAAVVAIDPDGDTLTYTLSGSDAESFSIDAGTGQVQTKAGVSYDYETQASYSLVVTADDPNGGTASILVTVNLTDVEEDDPNQAPVFDEGDSATRTLAENTAGGENVGVPLTATDPDEDTLTYTLSGADVGSFNLNAATGQLTTREGATYDYETKSTYEVTVTAEDPEGGSASIAVTINLMNVEEAGHNEAPVFDEGHSATRTLAENAAGGENVGLPLAATDQDDDNLTYALSGADAGSFNLDHATGQLTAKTGVTYDYEAQVSYSLVVTADDGKGLSASISVAVNLTDVNERPVFDEGSSAMRQVAENSGAGVNVGSPITATDPDHGDTVSYSLSGTDAASFEIGATTGQITTKAGATYDYESKSTYEVTVEASDGNGGTASIAVAVNLTDVAEAKPVTACFTQMGTLSATAEYAGSWNDADCRAHHQDSRGRYFQFTLSADATVSVSLSAGTLYVSKDTPNNGWGTAPQGTYEHRREVRRGNGKLVHDGSANTATLNLAAGETYTVEAAGNSGDFTISIGPQ